jgi:glucose-1-phosphate thymidylyltransferase
MKKIVEKPSEPISRRANIGLYYIKDWKTLFDGIAWTRQQPPHKGEYFLTDAFQYMVDHGKRLLAAPVGGWYDCGKVDTVLETNRHLLEHGHSSHPKAKPQVKIVDPVCIADGVELEDCTVGPNVTIGKGTVIRKSTLRDSVIGEKSKVVDSTIEGSMIGDETEIAGRKLSAMIAQGSEVVKAP